MNRSERAIEAFRGGANCSQSVLLAFEKDFGLDHETALAISRGFGGGIGHTGATCGAATGAVMVLGLATGRGVDNRQAKHETYALVQEFFVRFRKRNGALLCRELLGHDIGLPEGEAVIREQNLFETVCEPIIRNAIGILEEMLTTAV